MAAISFAADSTTLVLNGHIFNDFVAGDKMDLQPVNPLTSQVDSSNGGVNIQKRSDSGKHTLVIRVPKMSDDDVYLNSVINQKLPVVLNGSMKDNFVKDGVDGVESYILENGSITTQPGNTKNDQDGNALMEYTVLFRNAQRNL